MEVEKLRVVIWHIFFWGNVQSEKLSEIKPPLKPYLFLELHIVPICIQPALKIHPNWHRRGNKLETLFPSGLNKSNCDAFNNNFMFVTKIQ